MYTDIYIKYQHLHSMYIVRRSHEYSLSSFRVHIIIPQLPTLYPTHVSVYINIYMCTYMYIHVYMNVYLYINT